MSLLSGAVALGSQPSHGPGPASPWEVDAELGFHYAWLFPDDSRASGAKCEQTGLNFRAAYAPDIDNIKYDEFVSLGFGTPEMPDAASKKLFLKLYEYPGVLDAHVSASKVFAGFALEAIPEAAYLKGFAESRPLAKAALIEDGDTVFSSETPYPCPPFGAENVDFDAHTPFYSVYLKPRLKTMAGDDDTRASFSAKPVSAFHNELLDAYRRQLRELTALESDTSYFFQVPHPDAETETLLEMSKAPMIFDNGVWRTLPMPQAANMFLSGLLLVHRHTYRVSPGANDVTAPDFFARATKLRTTTLEVGSVYRQ